MLIVLLILNVYVMEPSCLDDVRPRDARRRRFRMLESTISVLHRVRVFNTHDLHLGKSAICKELIFLRDVFTHPAHMWKKFIVQ